MDNGHSDYVGGSTAYLGFTGVQRRARRLPGDIELDLHAVIARAVCGSHSAAYEIQGSCGERSRCCPDAPASQPSPGADRKRPEARAAPRYALTPVAFEAVRHQRFRTGLPAPADHFTPRCGRSREGCARSVFPRDSLAPKAWAQPRGELIGVAINAKANQRRASIRRRQIDSASGRQSKPFAINDTGAIAGEAILARARHSAAVLWKGEP